MKRMFWVMAAWVLSTAATAADTASLLSQGKLDADLGKHEQAASAFQAVADDAKAPAASRAEALLRLGLLRRQTSDTAAAHRAFERVWSEHRGDKEVMRQLVHAITGATPVGHYWDDNWQGVVLVVDEVGPRLEWPGQGPGRRLYKGEPISIDTRD